MRPVVRAFSLAVSVSTALGIAGCPAHDEATPAVPTRACGLDVWIKPASREASVELVGSWNGFARPGVPVSASREDGWRTAHVDVPAGEHRYAFVEDGVFHADTNVATTAWEGTREVSWTRVADCRAPSLTIDGVERRDDHALVRATFRAAATRGNIALDARSIRVRTRDGEVVAPLAIDARAARGTIEITLPPRERGKHVYIIEAKDKDGRATAPARVSVWSDARDLAKEDGIVYQIMIDRFANDQGAVAPPAEAGGRAGGTLGGVTRAITRGDFEAMGVTTLWLSPVYTNPEGFFSGGIGRRFAGYHGYWPIDTRGVDARIGGEAALDTLMQTAHAHGLRVLFDVVPNHVHSQHPYWANRASVEGFNAPDGKCLCGQGDCPWSTSIERCWFAPYLPDLDTRREEVLSRTVEDVLFWLDRYDADGLRIDAVPMMPRSTTRRIAALARERFQHAGHSLYLIGETFTSEQGFDALRYNLGPMGLDGQFHFPLMWAMRKAIASEAAPLGIIDDAIRAGEESFRGSGAVMATMIGNHDVTRFASESDGTAGGDGFDPAPTPTDEAVYAKQRLALGLLFALPGVPVVYYGDEIALAGRSDPDSRRAMPDETVWTTQQRAVRDFSRKLGKTRGACEALRRGAYRALDRGDGRDAPETFAFARTVPDRGSAVVVAARRPINAGANVQLTIPRDAAPPGRYVDVLDRSSPAVIVGDDGLTSVSLPPFSLRILLPEGDPCIAAIP